jgi:hypothetical protein
VLLTLTEPPAQRAHHRAWSAFRRRHQAVAHRCHAARRDRPGHPAGEPPLQPVASTLPDLTDARWTRIARVLPPASGTGRPASDPRTVVAGILWIIQRGAAWSELPPIFGSWQTVNRRYRRWREDGTWAQILAALRAADP